MDEHRNNVGDGAQVPTPGQPLSEADVSLLPCPFCGSPPVVEEWHCGGPEPTMISCSLREYGDEHGGCSVGPLHAAETYAQAIAAWNRRPHAPVSRPGDGVEWENMEASAWRWLSRLYPNDAPADLAYDANEMVDAFVAGAGEASRMAKALWRIAEERQYRAGYCQTDFAVEPALTAEEAQAVAREALSPIGPALTPPAEPVSRPAGEGEREAVARVIRQHVKVDATGLAPAVASVLLVGIEEAADAVISLLCPAAPDAGGGWMPIETAPKDGTVIDVWREDGGRDTVFWGKPSHTCGEAGSYCDSDWHSIRAAGWVCNTFDEFVGRKHNPFTHWMPLPAPPALQQEEE